MSRSKKSNGVYRTCSEKLTFVNEVDKLRSEGKKVREAVKLANKTAKGSYRSYYVYKREIENGTLIDARISPITDQHVEYIGAFVCGWPHASLDSYMTVLFQLFPNDMNRTKLYNFLLLNGLSNRSDRKRKVSLFMKRQEEDIQSYTTYYAFRTLDASLRSQFKTDKDIPGKIVRERKGFWKRQFHKFENEKSGAQENSPKHGYRSLFKKFPNKL